MNLSTQRDGESLTTVIADLHLDIDNLKNVLVLNSPNPLTMEEAGCLVVWNATGDKEILMRAT